MHFLCKEICKQKWTNRTAYLYSSLHLKYRDVTCLLLMQDNIFDLPRSPWYFFWDDDSPALFWICEIFAFYLILSCFEGIYFPNLYLKELAWIQTISLRSKGILNIIYDVAFETNPFTKQFRVLSRMLTTGCQFPKPPSNY